MKIAVPVSGKGLKIVTRTGRAPFFAIFQLEGGNFKFLELRENGHAREHKEESHHNSVQPEPHTPEEIEHHYQHLREAGLEECQFIVVRGLGPNMRSALERAGVKIVKVSKQIGDMAPEILNKIREQFQME